VGLLHFLFHNLAGFERHHGLAGHHHFLARARVARLASLAHAHFEHAEVAQLVALFSGQNLDDAVQRHLDDLLDLLLLNIGFLSNLYYQFVLSHRSSTSKKRALPAPRTSRREVAEAPSVVACAMVMAES